jgi:hypothetical protein
MTKSDTKVDQCCSGLIVVIIIVIVIISLVLVIDDIPRLLLSSFSLVVLAGCCSLPTDFLDVSGCHPTRCQVMIGHFPHQIGHGC